MAEEREKRRAARWRRAWLILGVLVLAAAAVVFWWTKHYVYAGEIEATNLTQQEQQGLARKLVRVAQPKAGQRRPVVGADGQPLAPEPYSETDAARELVFTERELNALISRDPTLARRMAVALSPELVSVTALLPIAQEVPLLGGKTFRLRLGVKLAYQAGAPAVALQGVSVGGVPLPKAWLGDFKYKNLVEEFGSSGGFWRAFAAGIDGLEVGEGQIRIRLKD